MASSFIVPRSALFLPPETEDVALLQGWPISPRIMPRVPVVVAPVKDVSHLWLPQNAATGDLDRVALGDGTITGTDAFDDFGRYFDGSSNYLSWDSAGSVGPWLGDGQSYSAFAIFRVETLAADQAVLAATSTASNTPFVIIELDTTGAIAARARGDAGTDASTPVSTFTLNTFGVGDVVFAALAYDAVNNTLEICANGERTITTSWDAYFAGETNENITVGAMRRITTVEPFTGSVMMAGWINSYQDPTKLSGELYEKGVKAFFNPVYNNAFVFQPALESSEGTGAGTGQAGELTLTVSFSGAGTAGTGAGTGQVGQLTLDFVDTGTQSTATGTGQDGVLDLSFTGEGSYEDGGGTGYAGTFVSDFFGLPANLVDGDINDLSGWNKLRVSSATYENTAYGPATKFVADGNTDPYVYKQKETGGALGDREFSWTVRLWTDAGQPTNAQIYFYDASFGDVTGSANLVLGTTPQDYQITNLFDSAESDTSITYRIDLAQTAAAGEYLYAQWARFIEQTGLTDFGTGQAGSFSVNIVYEGTAGTGAGAGQSGELDATTPPPTLSAISVINVGLTVATPVVTVVLYQSQGNFADIGTNGAGVGTGQAGTSNIRDNFIDEGVAGTGAGTGHSGIPNIIDNSSPDTTPPEFVSANVDATGTVLTITFNENMKDNSPTGFTLLADGQNISLSNVSVSGANILYDCSPPAYAYQVLVLSYTPGTAQDTSDNNLAAF